ncbi:hypothetical protein KCV06_g667, partial [Aureobasidium melanogenum]
MPPTSSVRKASVATTDTNSGRRQSARQPRTSTSRPINYYARTFGQLDNNHDQQDPDPPGFFPAVQYFADSIAALPREVQRHITLMKEVEAKVYGPTEALKFLTSSILNKPAPLSRNQPSSPRLLSFTAPPSATASLAGSVVNGNQPLTFDQRVQDDLESQQDEQADHARRSEFQSLRHVIGNMITNLDEKNVVMAEANRALAQQLARLDSVMPHIENEISEESRLGSLTHWAYQDNRTKKQTTTSQSERNRRDVAATSSLAAAAAAVHDQDIAAARGEARRETKKTNRAQAMDSDFDDRPTKRAQTGKSRKNADAEPKGSGLGIANGIATAATTKRRKVEKAPTGGAPAMERSASGMSTVTKAARGAGNTTPRSTPAVETTKKKGKPGLAPGTGAGKKRNTALNQITNSPRLPNSSPTRFFPHAAKFEFELDVESTALAASRKRSQPSSIGRRQQICQWQYQRTCRASSTFDCVKQRGQGKRGREALKNEDVTMEDVSTDVRPRRGSITSTPRTEAFPDLQSQPRCRQASRRERDRGNGSRGTTTSRRTEASQEADDEPAEVEMEGEGEEAGQVADEDEGEEGEDGDEPKYCYCGQGSFGEMIACDNDDCPMEWFHLGCTGLRAVPGDNVKWFCDVCKEPKGKKAKMMAARH